MELRQIQGDTWVLEGSELIPVFKVDARRCILLDAGLSSEQEDLTHTLSRAGLTPVGVFGSHAHRDHWGGSQFLRRRYATRLSLPEGEAALCLSALLYRAAYDTFTPRALTAEYGHMLGRVDESVGPEDGTVEFCGVPFEVLHVPGHSPDQIATRTPDGVLYVADAVFGADFLRAAKLPYHYAHEEARKSIEKLCKTPCGCYITAHRAVGGDMDALGRENLRALDEHCAVLAALIEGSMTKDEILLAAMRHYRTLTSKEEKAARFDRNIRTLLEYLQDTGRVVVGVREGVRRYRRAEE